MSSVNFNVKTPKDQQDGSFIIWANNYSELILIWMADFFYIWIINLTLVTVPGG